MIDGDKSSTESTRIRRKHSTKESSNVARSLSTERRQGPSSRSTGTRATSTGSEMVKRMHRLTISGSNDVAFKMFRRKLSARHLLKRYRDIRYKFSSISKADDTNLSSLNTLLSEIKIILCLNKYEDEESKDTDNVIPKDVGRLIKHQSPKEGRSRNLYHKVDLTPNMKIRRKIIQKLYEYQRKCEDMLIQDDGLDNWLNKTVSNLKVQQSLLRQNLATGCSNKEISLTELQEQAKSLMSKASVSDRLNISVFRQFERLLSGNIRLATICTDPSWIIRINIEKSQSKLNYIKKYCASFHNPEYQSLKRVQLLLNQTKDISKLLTEMKQSQLQMSHDQSIRVASIIEEAHEYYDTLLINQKTLKMCLSPAFRPVYKALIKIRSELWNLSDDDRRLATKGSLVIDPTELMVYQRKLFALDPSCSYRKEETWVSASTHQAAQMPILHIQPRTPIISDTRPQSSNSGPATNNNLALSVKEASIESSSQNKNDALKHVNQKILHNNLTNSDISSTVYSNLALECPTLLPAALIQSKLEAAAPENAGKKDYSSYQTELYSDEAFSPKQSDILISQIPNTFPAIPRLQKEANIYAYRHSAYRRAFVSTKGEGESKKAEPLVQSILYELLYDAYELLYQISNQIEPVSIVLIPLQTKLLSLKRMLSELWRVYLAPSHMLYPSEFKRPSRHRSHQRRAGSSKRSRHLFHIYELKLDLERALMPLKMQLKSIDDQRQDGKFIDPATGKIPPGQAALHSLLAECYDLMDRLSDFVEDTSSSTSSLSTDEIEEDDYGNDSLYTDEFNYLTHKLQSNKNIEAMANFQESPSILKSPQSTSEGKEILGTPTSTASKTTPSTTGNLVAHPSLLKTVQTAAMSEESETVPSTVSDASSSISALLARVCDSGTEFERDDDRLQGMGQYALPVIPLRKLEPSSQ